MQLTRKISGEVEICWQLSCLGVDLFFIAIYDSLSFVGSAHRFRMANDTKSRRALEKQKTFFMHEISESIE